MRTSKCSTQQHSGQSAAVAVFCINQIDNKVKPSGARTLSGVVEQSLVTSDNGLRAMVSIAITSQQCSGAADTSRE